MARRTTAQPTRPRHASRVALVTGAASGLGAALTRQLLAEGARVLALDLSRDALDAQHGEHPHLRKRAHDVRDRADAALAVTELLGAWERLDLAIHNAGVVGGGPLQQFDPATSDRILDVNLRGVLHGTEAAYAQMCRQGAGQIINVASMAGLHAVPYSAVYAASKHGVVGLSLSLREEARAQGVRVSVACPGLIATSIFSSATDAGGYRYARQVARVPGGAQRPEDAARALLTGAAADDAVITFPRSSRALAVATRLAPGLLRRAIGLTMSPR